MNRLTFPLDDPQDLKRLSCGEKVLIDGKILAMRDSTLTLLTSVFPAEELKNILKPGSAVFLSSVSSKENITTVGPTSTYRMEEKLVSLIPLGIRALIGKGSVSVNFLAALTQNDCVYLGFPGGLSALLSKNVQKAEILKFSHLGSEALWELHVSGMPFFVFSDLSGNYFFR
ncbi:fumarate hydratase C-terminal domain-containing protein [candidate division WOR-3 bacterium]|nr:fumarate hydratase C-terminal domain-containing protein [candidate division WOR-3 bacterium]